MPSLWPALVKDPAETIDVGIDWGTKWLPAGDAISASTWTPPAGLTVTSDSHTATTTAALVSGGTAGASYDLVNHITTTGGRVGERTITVDVTDL
jgi:hypothetical protein